MNWFILNVSKTFPTRHIGWTVQYSQCAAFDIRRAVLCKQLSIALYCFWRLRVALCFMGKKQDVEIKGFGVQSTVCWSFQNICGPWLMGSWGGMCRNCAAIFGLLIELGAYTCAAGYVALFWGGGGKGAIFIDAPDRENRALREVYFAVPVRFIF
jgi:hypothetical protein